MFIQGCASYAFPIANSRIRALPKSSGLRRVRNRPARSARSLPRSGAHDEKEPHCHRRIHAPLARWRRPGLCSKQRHAVRRARRRHRLHQQRRARRGLGNGERLCARQPLGHEGFGGSGRRAEGRVSTGKRLRREFGTARPGRPHVRPPGLCGAERRPFRHGHARSPVRFGGRLPRADHGQRQLGRLPVRASV